MSISQFLAWWNIINLPGISSPPQREYAPPFFLFRISRGNFSRLSRSAGVWWKFRCSEGLGLSVLHKYMYSHRLKTFGFISGDTRARASLLITQGPLHPRYLTKFLWKYKQEYAQFAWEIRRKRESTNWFPRNCVKGEKYIAKSFPPRWSRYFSAKRKS